jgi:hypothetical protein
MLSLEVAQLVAETDAEMFGAKTESKQVKQIDPIEVHQ